MSSDYLWLTTRRMTVQWTEWVPLGSMANLMCLDDSSGIYIVARPNSLPSRTWVSSKVGQGVIVDRCRTHYADNEVIREAHGRPLLVTWTPVDYRLRDNVERYLGYLLRPILAERYPDVAPVAVNLPGELPAWVYNALTNAPLQRFGRLPNALW